MSKNAQTNAIDTSNVAAAPAAAPAAEVAAAPRGRERDPNSKASKARVLFADMTAKGARRCDIIKAMQEQVGMTPSGAATYLQNFKKEAGLVKAKE
jgi:hypothetical protein